MKIRYWRKAPIAQYMAYQLPPTESFLTPSMHVLCSIVGHDPRVVEVGIVASRRHLVAAAVWETFGR